jgi:hypothetical protein
VPLLEDYCYACHGNGIKKGKVCFDDVAANPTRLRDRDFWWAVLRNVRAHIMPPAGKPRPSEADLRLLEDWIKYDAFGIDRADPDPGSVTVRRLNRVEYRNTVRELLGVDFDTTFEFPPDDAGFGFDSIGDVLTLSPQLMEKYLAAARSIVLQAVPSTSRAVAETSIVGGRFRRAGAGRDAGGNNDMAPLSLSYYEPALVSTTFQARYAGRYRLIVEFTASERYVDGVFDYNKCRLTFKDGNFELFSHDYGRQDGRPLRYEFDRDWQAGPHELSFELKPLTPGEKQVRSLSIRIQSVNIRGPFEERYWTRPPNYERFFPGKVPDTRAERRRYTEELLKPFATKAFRRPVDDDTVARLADLATSVSSQKGQTFETGAAQAMVAVLASPRFLFREEGTEDASADRYPLIDEYALASRLSYFLWSSMPDDELFRLAAAHQLRRNLHAQVVRMLADRRSGELIRHFVGQWLQARDIETVLINAFAVITRDQPPDPEAIRRRQRFRELNRKPPESLTDKEKEELKTVRAAFFASFRRFREFDLDRELRKAMRQETEMLFEFVVRNDRSLVELLDCNYTFLNARLAKHYGIEGVQGDQMRKFDLPQASPRGGVLTQGTVLAVTSNPDRTSPVKRGLFILDNLLGTPPPPPPPDIPPLEDADKKLAGKSPTLRDTLALHRNQPLCSSCHNRMDPLGLALENFNALGRWRDKERGRPIDAGARLISGESFSGIRELKRILVEEHRRDFYRCLSEKMLTYALGRGLGALDVDAVDQLVARIEQHDGRAGALIQGIIDSAPFQRSRRLTAEKPQNSAVRTSDRTVPSSRPGRGHDIPG